MATNRFSGQDEPLSDFPVEKPEANDFPVEKPVRDERTMLIIALTVCIICMTVTFIVTALLIVPVIGIEATLWTWGWAIVGATVWTWAGRKLRQRKEKTIKGVEND